MRRRGRAAEKRTVRSGRVMPHRLGCLSYLRRRSWDPRGTRRGFVSSWQAGFERLEPRQLLAASAIISEFLASNSLGILDQDGNHSDWIEIQNTSASPLDLGGWYLTNDAANPTRWQFPSTTIAAGGFLTVFASGKDRRLSGQELHTNFSLDALGGYLALTMPDLSIASEFAPYPAQITDVSYGITATSTATAMLIDEQAPLRYNVPTQSSDLAAGWQNLGFNDTTAAWHVGATGIGYDTAPTASADFLTFVDTDIGSQMSRTVRSGTTQNPGPGYAAFVRIPFLLANKSQITSLTLQLHYDDGYVAYLNGIEVARANAFGGTPTWNSAASGSHADSAAVVYQNINLNSRIGNLVDGNNVLTIVGLNRASSSSDLSDFLIDPLLAATIVNPPAVGFMATPTPGAANQPGSLGFVADTQFSVGRGFYTSPFDVQITTSTPGAQIRYTLDGSMPTATTGLIYTGPIHISTTTNLRAAAFKTGYTPTNVDTQTYVFLADVLHQTGAGLPDYAVWGFDKNGDGKFDPDWEMDPDIINSPTYASQMIDAMTAIPSMSITIPWENMFGANGLGEYISGSGIPKTASTEYFTADGSKQFQLDDTIQIQGGTSDNRWKQDKLSFRLKFTGDVGPTKLNFPLFSDPFFDSGAAISFNTLILDAESNNVWTHPDTVQQLRATYIQDQYVADLQNLAGGTSVHGAYVHLYIDGLYWGVYYVHERPDDSFASSYQGGDKEDYDVLKHNATTAVNNSTTAVPDYAAFLNLVRQDLSIPANYQAVAGQLDLKAFADYMIVNYYVGNTDWSSATAVHNWYVNYDKTSGAGKWRYVSWDAEHVLENVNNNVLSVFQTGGPSEVQNQLIASADYRQLFADEIERLLFNGGVLTAQVAGSIFSKRASELNVAIIGESARWGDNRHASAPYTAANRNANVQALLTNYFPQRTQIVINQFIAKGWFSTLASPVFSNYGGTVDPGYQLSLSLPSGAPSGAVIYYTQDGSDPRLAGGGVSSTALVYSSALSINSAGHVIARIRDAGGNWSPAIDAVFLLSTPYPVRIVEMNYHPADRAGVADASDLEYIELLNTGAQAVDLKGLKIDRGVTYQFPVSLMLGSGQRIVIARTPPVFQSVYGTQISLAPGNYTGKLDNAGEEVRLVGPLGEVLQDFIYGDDDPWPGRADGNGSSLEIVNPLGDPSGYANWRSSYEYDGTPGTAGLGSVKRVVVNEVLTHEDAPQVDAIELLNTTGAPINIGGWYLSDTSDNYKKYRIPAAATIATGQYLVIDETAFNSAAPSGDNVPFDLSGSQDDDVWLLSADASGNLLGFENHVNLVPAADTVSLGRWPNATGDLYPMKSLTLGSANSGPMIGPVVISEVMYSPPGNNPDLQFVELTNVTAQPVALSNTIAGVGDQPWKIEGLGFTFANGTTIAPRASMVVVGFDPTLGSSATQLAAFRAAYGIGSDVQIVGGWTGTLDRPADDLKLMRPDAPPADNPVLVPYVLVDEVNYTSSAPWTSAANQQSNISLTRSATAIYGKEPSNWTGAPATPGNSTVAAVNLVRGDFSFDGQTGGADMADMIAALADVPGFEASHGLTDADWQFIGDMNGDHAVNNLDLQGLLTLLISSGSAGGGSESAADAGSGLPARIATTSIVPPIAMPAADAVETAPLAATVDTGIAGSSGLLIAPEINATRLDAIVPPGIQPNRGRPANASKPPQTAAGNSHAVDQAIFGLHHDRCRRMHRGYIATVDQLDDFFAWMT